MIKLSYLFEISPFLEVVAKNVYGRFPSIRSFFKKKKSSIPIENHCLGDNFCFAKFSEQLSSHGVQKSDTLLVHSDMRKLSQLGVSSIDLINFFMENVCSQGTLVCPTFPLYRLEPTGVERFSKKNFNLELTYNVTKSRPWTGDLGRTLMRIAGSQRSLHPLNTLTSLGVATDRIFANESFDRLDLPCGPNSAWASLADLNAKILMIDTDVVHSLTMIHVAEDCYEYEWPIKDWYRLRRFKIINNDQVHHVNVRERHPRWSFSYAERRLSHDLYNQGIIKDFYIGPVRFSYLETSCLLSFLNIRKPTAYPFSHCWLSRL